MSWQQGTSVTHTHTHSSHVQTWTIVRWRVPTWRSTSAHFGNPPSQCDAQSGRDESLTLLLWPDQCTMAWLWDESPVKVNVELLSFSSSCFGPVALRSAPLQRNSERVTLRPAAELVSSPGSWLWAEPTGLLLLSSSPAFPLVLLARFLWRMAPARVFCSPLVLTLETFMLADSLSPVSPSAGRLSVLPCSLGCGCSARFSGAHSAEPAAQRRCRLSALSASDLTAPSPGPKTSLFNPVVDLLVSNFSNNSCARHLFPGWHDLQVISALEAWKKQSIIEIKNQNARCHFGRNMTSLSIAGGRGRCWGCKKVFHLTLIAAFSGCKLPLCCGRGSAAQVVALLRCSVVKKRKVVQVEGFDQMKPCTHGGGADPHRYAGLTFFIFVISHHMLGYNLGTQ